MTNPTDSEEGFVEHACGWWVGPVWKLDGEVCVCVKTEHLPDDPTHKCSCGTWFERCGYPPNQRHPKARKP